MKPRNPCRLRLEELEPRNAPAPVLILEGPVGQPAPEILAAILAPVSPITNHGACVTIPAGHGIPFDGPQFSANVPHDVTACLSTVSITPLLPAVQSA